MTASNTEADTCRKYVLPKLYAAGWKDEFISEQKSFTDGRIMPSERGHTRLSRKKADYLLNIRPDFPIAVVEAKKDLRLPADGLQQAMAYAQMLGLKFAYSTNGKAIVEHDFITGKQSLLADFPAPEGLWARLQKTLGVQTDKDVEDYLCPFNRELRRTDGDIKTPHYYQRQAIQAAVQAVINGKPRILLTMATGTGKTFVATQIVWKLWKTRRKNRILYLADRDILIEQPRNGEFSIFGEAVHRIKGVAKKGREIYFATYQSIADNEDRPGLYKEYPRDYFDLIIVDECHRGSAKAESNWRRILDHFTSATQIGMTATPKRDANVDTYDYFKEPVYTYSLAQGIEDGFLAPYKVRRVVPNVDANGWRPSPGQRDRFGKEIPDRIYKTGDFERILSMLARTEAVAHHLSNYMKSTDRFGKTIVFCVDQPHAQQMRDALQKENEDLTKEFPNYVARIVSDEEDIGRDFLADFKDPEKKIPVIVTTSQMLTTGVDVPTCKNVVIFKPINSMVEFKQIIGRGTRIAEDSGKLWFTILDYANATRLFEDKGFDGDPAHEDEETIDSNGETVSKKNERPNTRVEDSSDEGYVSPGPDGDENQRKYYVDGVHVVIANDTAYEIGPNNLKLSTMRFTDYAQKQVRTLFRSKDELLEQWNRDGQHETIESALAERGITVEALAQAANRSDADLLDLLIHTAWHAPLKSRRERVAKARKHQEFFERYSLPAREILNELLEKYVDYGIRELQDLKVLEIPPLSSRGTVVEIAKIFGGPEKLKRAIAELRGIIYAA